MSLILEALKKVEREKQTRDAGAVVIGATAWAAGPRRRWPMAVALALTAALGAGTAAFFLRAPRNTAPAPTSAPATLPFAPATPAAAPAVAPPQTLAPPLAASLPALPGTVAIAPLRRPPASLRTPAATTTVPAAPTARPEAPAASAPTAPAGQPALRLQAITEQDGQPVAMLNDRLVREGDSVDGALVIRIGAGEVEVEVDGRRQVLRF